MPVSAPPPPPPDVARLCAEAARLIQARRPDAALAPLRRALSLAPDDVTTNLTWGVAQLLLGRIPEAEQQFRGVIQRAPGLAVAHANLGHCLSNQGQHTEALLSYARALEIDPAFVDALSGSVMALRQLGRVQEAIRACRHLLQLQPDRPDILLTLGSMLADQPRNTDGAEAEALLQRAVQLAPQMAEAHTNLGNAQMNNRKLDAALASHERALALAPKLPVIRLNISNVLSRLNRPEEAERHCREGLKLQPDWSEIMVNLGNARAAQNDDDDAERWYRAAIAQRPDYANGHMVLASLHLKQGKFAAGWQGYEWRWKWPKFASPHRNFSQPQWSRAARAGARVLIHAEQGFGDSFQFLRFASLVKRLGYKTVIEVPKPIAALAESLDGGQVAVAGGSLPKFDYQIPMLSLPLALGITLETLPATVPYLHADPKRVAAWKRRTNAGGRPLVGIVWAGNPHHPNDVARSLPLAKLAPLFDTPGIHWANFQKAVPSEDHALFEALGDRLAPWAADFQDFSDTAAAIMATDLVITVDTAVAHLAGALGHPVWLMLPTPAEWRWMRDGTASPWYPTARLFRQPVPGDWAGTIAQIGQELSQLAAKA